MHFNKSLDYFWRAWDLYKNAHLRVSAGLKNYSTEFDQGSCFVTLEVEENMVQKLAEKNGVNMIGPNSLDLIGGGIEKVIKENEK